ncbi:Dipeptide transport ATP-binding protein DppF (TC 3.A.1.5.2) [hydrothermal vent metagenome]|uniref:Dipeptide transport ATP-binding protein DppF (TC 3.A.1.5.2) n=1 Tax=hydrothermal vent metagenome TaxID=652676 RepID=A0A3B0TEF0_9ZZZZ
MNVLVSAKNLTRNYDISRGPFSTPLKLRALAGASFELEAGKTLAVVGESGCGKSTLARILTMIEPASGGELIIDGRNVTNGRHEDLKALRSVVQIVFQDPYGSLNPRQKVGAILEEPLVINTSLSRSQRRERAHDMLNEVGLRPEHYERYPHMFSGGQRQRIAVARALMMEPKILVLDEPVSALDVSIQAQILNLMADLQEKHGLTYVFISHDLSVVRYVADEVMVMYLGAPVEVSSAKELFANPKHPYTRALLSATPIADPEKRSERIRLEGELPSPITPPSGCAFHPRCPLANERCVSEFPALKHHGQVAIACHAVEEGRTS